MLEKGHNFASEIRKETGFRPSRRRTGRTSTDSAIETGVAQSSVTHMCGGSAKDVMGKGVTVHGLHVVQVFDSLAFTK